MTKPKTNSELRVALGLEGCKLYQVDFTSPDETSFVVVPVGEEPVFERLLKAMRESGDRFTVTFDETDTMPLDLAYWPEELLYRYSNE